MENRQFGEKEQMTDLLCGEKFLASNYNAVLLESATPEVVQTFTGLLGDTHRMQRELFEQMSSRGFYPVKKAQEQEIMQAKQKLSAKVSK